MLRNNYFKIWNKKKGKRKNKQMGQTESKESIS